MDFYEVLSRHYDVLFPPGAKQAAFLSDRLPKQGRVLDIGAGTGGYAAVMAEAGAVVEALEIGAMYPLLAARGEVCGFTAREMPMEGIAALEAAAYGMIVCIGNTLVHLTDLDETERFLKNCWRLMRPGARLILQIVNYDRILADRVLELPVISVPAQGLTLHRHYALGSGTVRFSTALRRGEDLWESETTLLALTQAQMCEALAAAGFETVQFFGDFTGIPWSAESPALIAVADK